MDNFDAPQPLNAIDIPQTAVVPCPAVSFKGRRAWKCPDCAHFHGLHDTMRGEPPDTEIPFPTRYRIICAHPIGRQMTEIEEDD